ncbi:MAG: cation:proton antiporter [Candidatus Micrarchaeota archaeon]|nr:cation:proton antiporter [Candidatus Micrarchaeota archaeon]
MEAAAAVGISITVIMLSAIIFDRLKLPNILGALVAGMLVGPYSPLASHSFFGIDFRSIIIAEPALVEVFAVLGAALILFGIGLEFSIIKIAQLGVFTFFAGIVKIGIAYAAGYALLSFFGLPPQSSALVALALSFSSTPIMIKLLEASGKIRRAEIPFIISISVIEDLLAVFFLGLIAKPAFQISEYGFILSLIRVFLTFIFTYLVLFRLVRYLLSAVSHSDELLLLSTVSLVLVIGYISEGIGLSFSVGAFLAGSILAGSPESKRIEEKIKPFNSLFSAFFFFSIGLFVSFSAVMSNIMLLSLFIIIGFAVRFIASGASAYFVGFPGRGACFCAAVFLPISELSLLLMSQGVASGLVQSELLGSFAFAIIASSFISAWLLNRENEIYGFLQAVSPQIAIKNFRLMRSTILGMRKAFSETARYYRVVEKLPSISHQYDSLSTREQMVLTAKNAVILLFASSACFSAIFLMQVPGWEFLSDFFIFAFAAFFISAALFQINAHSSADSLIKMIARSSNGEKYVLLGHIFSAGLFFSLAAIFALAYFAVPASLSIVLSLPALAFMAKSILKAARKALSGNMPLKRY